ncbi:type II toxin-antitoxin system VapC family toxin [Kribbella italica]|uniref:PIN domain nuclease of toxin-antitoxin system n=1 Tax=Kribbella italica TaxID=1540520 RepID=A0A7W9J1R3_9ACTN|nr:type II toxin-antitoxin system VapC family toxin [Kribbella italica]MBB5833709.1 PIN domain nuclease of toxin-antitoxin system [Kribbella italica]
MMLSPARLLLDTHVVLWWLSDSDELSLGVKDLIDSELEVYVSVASLWEISIKTAAGKLRMPEHWLDVIGQSGLLELPIRAHHAAEAGQLPPLHRDPFDRLLIAQAQHEGLTLVTRDKFIHAYEVEHLAA